MDDPPLFEGAVNVTDAFKYPAGAEPITGASGVV
jgi:hypothetical protein